MYFYNLKIKIYHFFNFHLRNFLRLFWPLRCFPRSGGSHRNYSYFHTAYRYFILSMNNYQLTTIFIVIHEDCCHGAQKWQRTQTKVFEEEQ